MGYISDSSLPADYALEMALLALIIEDSSILDRIHDLDPGDLHDPRHQCALASAMDLHDAGRPVNPVTMRSRMGLSGENAQHDLIGALQVFSAGNKLPAVGDVVSSLRELSLRRQVIHECTRACALIIDPSVSPKDAVGELMLKCDGLLARSRPQGATLLSLRTATEDFLQNLQEPEIVNQIPTSYRDLDAIIGGLPRGEMSILGGRPSMGKSAMALAMAMRQAKAGHGMLFVSQEMPNSPLMARVASMAYRLGNDGAELPYAKIQPQTLPLDVHVELARVMMSNVAPLPIMMEYRRGLTLSELASSVRRSRQELQKLGRNLDVVIVDHIGLMQPPLNKHGNRTVEMTQISDGLARVAKSENVALLALCQLNREVERQDDQRPSMHHLRDSGSIEQDATLVMFCFRESYRLERKMRESGPLSTQEMAALIATRNKMEVMVAKNRNGAPGTADLIVDMPHNVVRDQAREPA